MHILRRPGLGLMRQVLTSMDQVYDALNRMSDAPGRQKAPQLRVIDGIWRKYYGYPVHHLTVDGSIWEEVFETLVDGCGLFVVDLTAKGSAPGLQFELSHLFNYVEPERIVLLIDSAQADVDFCYAMVEQSWGGGGQPPAIFLYDSQASEYVASVFKGAFSGKSTLPIAAKALGALGWW